MKGLFTIAMMLMIATPLHAADLGVRGRMFPLGETDLLAAIRGELELAKRDGRIDALNETMRAQGKRVFFDPPPVAGLSPAPENRTRYFDPSIITNQDLRDHEGRIFAARGRRINPLARVRLSAPLVFIDGRVPGQVEWALEQSQAVRIVLVAGAPKPLMDAHQRRFYYDQHGKLSARFGLRHTPSRVSQAGMRLKIEEVYTP